MSHLTFKFVRSAVNIFSLQPISGRRIWCFASVVSCTNTRVSYWSSVTSFFSDVYLCTTGVVSVAVISSDSRRVLKYPYTKITCRR